MPFGFGLAVVSQFGARDGLRPKENAESNVFSHTTQTQTLRSPQLPRWQGDASPDGVRWWARHAAIAPPCADMVRAVPPPPLALEERRAAARSRSDEREFGGQGLA